MKEALYYEKIENSDDVRCLLCPHLCRVVKGKKGRCRVRHNIDGRLFSIIGDRCCSSQMDPIEKKPLYHFHPGSRILSLGTFGCNFSCQFCQNWSLSHPDEQYLSPDGINKVTQAITPREALQAALATVGKGNIGIAYTYNEPSIWYEFVLETSMLLKAQGLYNVLVTNGSMNEKPLRQLLPYIDAANVDIKSISPEFYQKYCQGSLEPVLEYCKIVNNQALLEITNLIIPTLNDSDQDLEGLVDWVADNLGSSVPIHFSRYHPDFKLDIPATPLSTLEKAYTIACKRLKYVYVGNIGNNPWDSTNCPQCHKAVIERKGMGVSHCSISENNTCIHCGTVIEIKGKCQKSW
jgi:pyruvate formate lyase activating enzyme